MDEETLLRWKEAAQNYTLHGGGAHPANIAAVLVQLVDEHLALQKEVEPQEPRFPLCRRFTPGQRCVYLGRAGSYPDHSKDRWGYITEIKRTVVHQIVEELVVTFDDGETRSINPDVIAHGEHWKGRDPREGER